MDTRIEYVETAGPGRRARRLVFADGSEPRTTSAAVVKEMGLEPGTPVERTVLESTLREAEELLAKERALRLLGYRERSVAEVDKRLADDGYPAAIREATVQRLVDLGLIDDERFALVFARSRLAAGYGTRKIGAELKQRGIEPPAVQRVMHEALGDEDELSRARKVLRGQVPSDRKERDRLLRKLVARGFDFGIAVAAVDADSRAEFDGPLVDE